MTDPRLVAPVIAPGEKIKGPASYFPSIERNYGRPIQDWIDVVAPRLAAGEGHMQVVEWLKSEHGMGHGHANAIVGWVKAKLAELSRTRPPRIVVAPVPPFVEGVNAAKVRARRRRRP